MTDTAKPASDQDTIEMSVDVFSDLIRQVKAKLSEREAETAALREEVERLRSVLRSCYEPMKALATCAWGIDSRLMVTIRMAIQQTETSLREGQSHVVDTRSCQDCGATVPTWFAPNHVWNKVVPGRVGMLCANCFMGRAESAGIICTGWKLEPENLEQK